jgi:hypothetical protein
MEVEAQCDSAPERRVAKEQGAFVAQSNAPGDAQAETDVTLLSRVERLKDGLTPCFGNARAGVPDLDDVSSRVCGSSDLNRPTALGRLRRVLDQATYRERELAGIDFDETGPRVDIELDCAPAWNARAGYGAAHALLCIDLTYRAREKMQVVWVVEQLVRLTHLVLDDGGQLL